jgi:predicted 3-demethylubiquinone-9 3-methyltransferase (glyoxalase superfamily)
MSITPFLWFDDNAEEAMNFYLSVFKDGKAGNVTRYGEAGPGPAGSVMTAAFEINGQEFIALNGGPMHAGFNLSVSFVVNCKTQHEVDELWDKLLAGGTAHACGWLQDKFGLAWQVVPEGFVELLSGDNPKKAAAAMAAMMTMEKLDINRLREAYAAG